MAGIFREELSRAFVNKRYWLVVVLAGISFTYGWAQVMQIQQGNPLSAVPLWQEMLKRGSYGFFAAIIAGLPFADSLLSDRRHHFIDQILLRCRYRQYLSAKMFSVLYSGMAAVTAPALILLMGCCLFYPTDQEFVSTMTFGITEFINPGVIEPGFDLVLSPAGYIIISLSMLLLFGAVYALLGLGSSFIIRNPFIVLGIPFIVYSLGYFIIPTSARLNWMGSTEAALLPSTALISPVFQYLVIAVLFLVCRLLWGRKNQLLSE